MVSRHGLGDHRPMNERCLPFRATKQVPNGGVLYKVLRRFYYQSSLYSLVRTLFNDGDLSNGLSVYLEPNEASPANVDAAKMFRENRVKFDDTAKRSVRKTLGL